MTTIDVLPLSDDSSGDNADNAPDKSEKDSITIENVEKLTETEPKRRGRPAGSKDGTKRKTPVRQKKNTEAPPPPPPPEPIVEPKIAPKKAPKKPTIQKKAENVVEAPAAVQTPMPDAAPPPMTAATFLREMQRQSRASQEEHWNRIIGPMFVH